jgi:hypothetical protein
MKEVEINKQAKLSEHFSLGEMTMTTYKTDDGNIPSRVAIENLTNLCEVWLEELRRSYNLLYGQSNAGVQTTPYPSYSGGEASGGITHPESEEASGRILPLSRGSQRGSEEPVIINSGYRSQEVNQKCGGARNSNHLTGCAVDIRCKDKAQAIRYGCILLDIADGKKLDFDELILEKRGTTIWVHFAVRPKGNRRYVDF